MSLLQRKLGLLSKNAQRQGGSGPSKSRRGAPDSSQHKSDLLAHLGGEFVTTRAGEILVIRQNYQMGESYGLHPLSAALEFDPSQLRTLYSGLEALRLNDALFFDTETTGLAGGSGTYAFLVGIGFFTTEGFVTEQLLMRDHGDEPALLEYLSDRVNERDGLVSFNGKTFDAQLLSTRYAMHSARLSIRRSWAL